MKREQRDHSASALRPMPLCQRHSPNVLQCAAYGTQARNTFISWHYACENTSTYNIFFRVLCFLVLLYLVYSQKKFICIRAQAFMEYMNPLINNSLYRSSSFLLLFPFETYIFFIGWFSCGPVLCHSGIRRCRTRTKNISLTMYRTVALLYSLLRSSTISCCLCVSTGW